MFTSEGFAKIKPLSNSDYPEWAGGMKAWLMQNGLWKLVSGRETKPRGNNDEKLNLWEAKAENVIIVYYFHLISSC